MRKVISFVSLLLSFVLMLAVGLSTAATATGSKHSTTGTNVPVTANEMKHVLAPPEALSGTITMVDPANNEVTLVGSNGVPYDFQLTRKTELKLANQRIGLSALAGELYKQATIHFVPTSDGNLVASIQVGGS